jgi:hypothetical protein
MFSLPLTGSGEEDAITIVRLKRISLGSYVCTDEERRRSGSRTFALGDP